MFHNPEQANYGALAHHYITLSRASLATDCVYVNTSVTAIDAMILHINYFEMSDDPGGGAKAWATLGTAIKLAQSVSYDSSTTKDTNTSFIAWLTVSSNYPGRE
jgi:hypothetical protein